jgi:nucleoside-diphosphate-sugar epimerase
MRIVITGAAGHIGGIAAQALSAHDLVLLDRRRVAGRRSTVVNLARPPGAQSPFPWARKWDRVFQGADAVVHLAAVVSPVSPWRSVLRHNIQATWHVLESAAAHGVPRVVFASSTWAIRGETDDPRANGHAQSTGSDVPPRPLTRYGASKAFGEVAGRMFVDEGRLGTFIAVRIGYCPPDGRFPTEDVARRWWVGPRDLGTLIRRCVEADVRGSHVVYGVSAVANCPFDLAYTRRLLDWAPSEVGEPSGLSRRS